MSVASCDRVIDVFEAIFFGKLPPGMLMSANKAIYVITDALHLHCKQNLMKNLGEAQSVLEYNKTRNSKGKRELHIRVHFRSSLRNQSVSRHLVTCFNCNATGEKIAKKMMSFGTRIYPLKDYKSARLPISIKRYGRK